MRVDPFGRRASTASSPPATWPTPTNFPGPMASLAAAIAAGQLAAVAIVQELAAPE